MRRFLVILSFIFVFAAAEALAGDALVGRVVSIRPENGAITVVPVGGEEEILVGFRDGKIPAGLAVGDMVRVWGDRDTLRGLFQAEEAMALPGGGSASDPTGVRRRLGSQGGAGHGGGFGFRGGRGGR